MDRHLVPLTHRLHVRLEPYRKYERPEDKVILYLQQLKERQNKLVQADLLNQCVGLMTDALGLAVEAHEQIKTVQLKRKSELVPAFKCLSLSMIESHLIQSHPAGQINVTSLERYHLLFAMMKHAQTLGMLEVVEICSSYILSFKWDHAEDSSKDFVINQIESYFTLAESLAERLAISKIENKERSEEDDGKTPCDPRALGLSHSMATEEMLKLKSLILATLRQGK